MTNTIRFHTDKNGKPVAFKWLHLAARWCRMNYDEAKLLESTESASTIYYGPNCWQPGRFEFTTIHKTDQMETVRISRIG